MVVVVAEDGSTGGILGADGKTPRELPLPAVRMKFKTEPAGTRVRLTVESGGHKREVTLVLRDLI